MVALSDDWPSYTDDAGTKTDGTIVDASLLDAIRDAIAGNIESVTNPAEVVADIVDEVVAARGEKTSLTARLDVSINGDGTLKAIAGQASQTDLISSLSVGNWLANDTFLVWPAAGSPAWWTVIGAGATAARTGTGLGDTTTKVGPYSVKLTRAAADCYLNQPVVGISSFAASGAHLAGKTFTFGAWVKTSVANAADMTMIDGVGSSSTATHSGDGTWQFLSNTITLDSSADRFIARLRMSNSSGDAYFSGAVVMPGQVALSDWVPCPTSLETIHWRYEGGVSTGTVLGNFVPPRPILIKDVQLAVGVIPTGAALIVDINQFNGAAYASMFSTRPQIAAGARWGAAQPDGTYELRCIDGYSGATVNDSAVSFDVDQIGSGTAGSNLDVMVRYLQYNRPQEPLLDISE